MNRLKEKSVRDLVGVLICGIVISPILFVLLKHGKGVGLVQLLIVLVAGFAVIIRDGLREFRFYDALDEREKSIYTKAALVSFGVFGTFWFIFTFTVCFLVGGKGAIPAGILPLAFIGSALITQLLQTVFLTVYFLKEGHDEPQGDAV